MRRVVAVVLAFALCAGLVACSPKAPPAAKKPAPPQLDTPRAAVDSYLAWVSYAYRIADAKPAAPTMSPDEFVRVDAYVERNRQENKGIEQRILSFDERAASRDASTAVIAARERWEYRYFSLRPLAYTSEPLQASYDTTYTLVRTSAGWNVDDIAVREMGDVE